MKSVALVLRELFANRERLIRLALYENKASLGGTVLGKIWNVLNPLLQILVYWFVFSLALKVTPRDGTPYMLWMMCGLMPWFYLNGCMMTTTTSVYQVAFMLKSITFPIALVPAKAVVSGLIDHCWTLLVLVAALLIGGVEASLYWLELPYYMLCATAFLLAFGLVSSSINAVFKDFQRFLNPILRLLFYFSSVVWAFDALPSKLVHIMKLNPLAYVVDGYRYCLIYKTGILANWQHALYFWVFTGVMFFIGCHLHGKLRSRFIDLI